jgi:alkylhydroperoxidase/carboxymuconolactone decarboxylase family protein YurZ
MSKFVPGFVEVFRQYDPKMVEMVADMREHAMAPGALDTKTKLLIAMALDAALGAEHGVTTLSDAARKAGASEAEIVETLRIVYYISGVGSLSTSSHAYKTE